MENVTKCVRLIVLKKQALCSQQSVGKMLFRPRMLEWVVGTVLSLKLGWSAGRCL